jgi:hypothetical protein
MIEFTNKINEGFEALLLLVEIQKTGNEDLTDILIQVENGG